MNTEVIYKFKINKMSDKSTVKESEYLTGTFNYILKECRNVLSIPRQFRILDISVYNCKGTRLYYQFQLKKNNIRESYDSYVYKISSILKIRREFIDKIYEGSNCVLVYSERYRTYRIFNMDENKIDSILRDSLEIFGIRDVLTIINSDLDSISINMGDAILRKSEVKNFILGAVSNTSKKVCI